MMLREPAREAPAPPPLFHGQEPPGGKAADEPTLEIQSIQGNIIPGFKKDFQALLFLRISDKEAFRRWLRSLKPFIATAADVLAFNRLFKSLRARRGDSRALQAVWINIAFSYRALVKLAKEAKRFTDPAFRQGMAGRAVAELGDPSDVNAPGHPHGWLVGGPHNEADAVLIVAGDDRDDVAAMVDRLENSIFGARNLDGTIQPGGARVVFKQHGAVLPAPLTGHEHFGFLDGISHPGVRGRVSRGLTDYLTPRQNPHDPNQGKPGQDLLWPGEFVFGYVGQDARKDVEDHADLPTEAGPRWARNGSFLVFRRLRQDVGAFHRFLHDTARQLGIAPALLAAKLVGRWPSGAPVLRAPSNDDPALGDNDCANNNFEYFKASTGTPPDRVPDPAGPALACGEEGQFPNSPGDPDGRIVPRCAHIRRAYPRDDVTLAGDGRGNEALSERSERDTQTHRMLRRGIPYGPPSRSRPEAPEDDDADRGLLFLSYQTSIVRQFEYVTKHFFNNVGGRRGGFDLLVGQNNRRRDRRRTARVILARGGSERAATLTTTVDWVVPTGGGYFFAPSLEALATLAGDT